VFSAGQTAIKGIGIRIGRGIATFGAGTTKILPADEDEDCNEDSATDDQLSRHFLPVRPPK